MKTLFEGVLTKMQTTWHAPVEYALQAVSLNPLIGRRIVVDFLGEIYCIQCQRRTAKSFQQGFCFPCFKRLHECGFCMIHPERCRHSEGVCDPADWVHASCGMPHIVYFANTVHVKVGITRKTQVPTRWIDQGAIQAIPVFETTNRYAAGQVEVWLKQHFPDKTPWQAMLKHQVEPCDLGVLREQFLQEKKSILQEAMTQLQLLEIFPCADEPIAIEYPVKQYPLTIKTLNFEKTPHVEGILLGIKGQYLLLDTGVLNVRKFAGYRVLFQCQEGG